MIKDKIRNAKDINPPAKNTEILNPIFYAILIPNERTELVAIPRIGKTIYIVDYVTLES